MYNVPTVPRFANHIALRLALLALVSLSSVPLHAQRKSAREADDTVAVSDAVRQAHLVHIAPHLVVFDPSHTTTTLELRNDGSTPTEADVLVELGYTFWQNTDSTLTRRRGTREEPWDTVIVSPTARDHSAAAWLSGIPSHVRLQPHQTQRVTLTITPPPNVPNGEYYARVVTVVRPQHHDPGQPKDVKQIYKLPLVGARTVVQPLRDSTRVFFRKGPQTMGLQLSQAHITFDSASKDGEGGILGALPIRYKVHMHLTGTAHFEGYKSNYYLLANGETIQVSDPRGQAFAIHHDGYMSVDVSTDGLSPGPQTFVFRLIPRQDAFPANQQLPMQPVEIKIPFVMP